MMLSGYDESTPLAIFRPCAGSHPFDERNVLVNTGGEEHAAKIGRSVARWKANPNNAIFDCKVLSRNHAVLFYEDGSFYLRDTKSSNGTFVNNDRLSKSGEESSPRQIFSGDLIQLGVEIVESSNKAHGCIMSMIILYNERGEEITNDNGDRLTDVSDSSTATAIPNDFMFMTPKQLFQMQHYIKEALFREKALEEKLVTLQEVLFKAVNSSEDSWQALINEDRLLARIEMLEGQLALFSKSTTSDTLRQHVADLLQQRDDYETKSKQILQLFEEEKREASLRILDLERSLNNTENEITLVNIKHEKALTSLLEENEKLKSEIGTISDRLKDQDNQDEQVVDVTSHLLSGDGVELPPPEKLNGLCVGPYSIQDYAKKIGLCCVETFDSVAYDGLKYSSKPNPVDDDDDRATVRGKIQPDRLSTITEESRSNYSYADEVEKEGNLTNEKLDNEKTSGEDQLEDMNIPQDNSYSYSSQSSIMTSHTDIDYDDSDVSVNGDIRVRAVEDQFVIPGFPSTGQENPELKPEDEEVKESACEFNTQQDDASEGTEEQKQTSTEDEAESELLAKYGNGSHQENGKKNETSSHMEATVLDYDVYPSVSYCEASFESSNDYMASNVLVCSVVPLLAVALVFIHMMLCISHRKGVCGKQD